MADRACWGCAVMEGLFPEGSATRHPAREAVPVGGGSWQRRGTLHTVSVTVLVSPRIRSSGRRASLSPTLGAAGSGLTAGLAGSPSLRPEACVQLAGGLGRSRLTLGPWPHSSCGFSLLERGP